MKPFQWIWQYIEVYKYRFFAALFFVVVASLVNLINPYISGVIVDKVILGKRTDLLYSLIAIMLITTLLKAAVRYTYQMLFESISQNIIFKVRKNIYSKLQELDFEFFNSTKTGDIMARMTGDTDAIRHFTAWTVYQIFEQATIFTFTLVTLFTINIKFALVLIAITPIIGFFAYKLAQDVKPTFFAIREQFSKLNSVSQENISGNRVVKAFAKEDYEISKFQKVNESYKDVNIASAKVWEKYLPVLDSLAGFMLVIMILIGGFFVINGTITHGILVTFNSFIWALNNPMRMAGWLINDVQRFVASTEKVRILLNTETKIKNTQSPVKNKNIKGTVEFHDVSFSYNNISILKNISFKAKPGQSVAIIGPTGSGKSTLVHLICRFYDCTSGEIHIDGFDIRDMELKNLRENVAVAMQDIFLFSDTIEGNIAYGVPNASNEQIVWAANMAGADDFIQNFSKGYNTIIGERGVGLSGGQKQRIALARALLKNPSVLILDDTTSSVDMETEHVINQSLKSIYKNKTTFVIAHRISSVKNADMILVIDEGHIIEQGRHDELLARRGYYFSVFSNQFGDFDSLQSNESQLSSVIA